MTILRTRLPVLLATAALAVGLSACGGGASDGYGGYDPAAPAEPVEAADPAASTPEVGTVLTANNTAQLGTVVIDGQGYTLYRFDKDSAKPPTSTCVGECAEKWPPVLATPGSPLTVEGVAQEAVGTINRPDGGIQLTLGGWPVYRYSGDTQPGTTSGQGVGGTWAAVTPEGGKASASS
jgi:predicted lipoprotein with Yx(FWY)xxD motif